MRKIILFISLVVFSSLFGQDIIELKLKNSNKLVIKFMFRNGSISDPAGKEGLTFTTANLMSQGGTEGLSYSEIQDFIYPMAANYGVTVDKEVSVFTFEVHNDFIDKFYPIAAGLITQPALAEADFNRIKLNQQNYVDQVIRASSDEVYSKKALEHFLFRGTNYQHMKQGTSSSVPNITLADVKQHYQKYFTKDNLVIGIAGNYDHEFLKRLKSDVTELPNLTSPLPVPASANTPKGIQIEIITKDDAFGSAIFTGSPLAITRGDDQFAALMVANSYLGEHRKDYSKLFQEIREKRSMNYGDYSYIEWYDQGHINILPPPGFPRSSNYFSIWIRPVQIAKQLSQQYQELADLKVGHAHFALRLALFEVNKLIEDGMTEEDFESTRTFLRSYIKLYIQTPADRLGYLMDSQYYGRDNYVKEMDALLAKLTLDDVNQAIKKYWTVDNMFVTIVTNTSEAQPLAESLKQNLPSPMSYSDIVKAGLPENIREKDRKVAKFKLNIGSVRIIDSAETFQ